MDNFTPTAAAVQEIYNITLLVRGILYKVDSYEAETQSIRARIEREYQFLNAFKSVFFNHEDANFYYAALPGHLTNEIKTISASLRSSLAIYSLLAIKHGISVIEPPVSGRVATNAAASDEPASRGLPSLMTKFQQTLYANLEHMRQSFDPLDWVLFGKDEILNLLDAYGICTSRLREVVTLILLLTRKSGFFENWNIATNPIGANLGLKAVAERQNRADGTPHSSFAPLGGDIRGESPYRPFRGYQVVEYDEGLHPGRIQVVLEEHTFNMPKDVYSGLSMTERRNKELQPIRTLAWLLRGETTREPPDVDVKGLKSMYTLECMGYIDRLAENYAILVYHVPASAARCVRAMTLHDFISAAIEPDFGQPKPTYLTKPTLGNRYFLAYALATTLFSIHSSRWLHRNIWSRGILIFPEQDQEARIVPYLVGWGAARPQEAEQTAPSMKHNEDINLELNIYRHPDRYGKSSVPCENKHDIYALGVILLEIGLWKTMSAQFAKPIARVSGHGILPSVAATVSQLTELARSEELKQSMGIEYANVVQRCLATDFDVESDDEKNIVLTSRFRSLVVERLEYGLLL